MTPSAIHAWLAAPAVPRLRPAQPPVGKRIAVIAPHPDDELLGCGGTLAICAADAPSVRVSVLYLTDGEAGAPEDGLGPETVAQIRREEACRGLAALGVIHAEFAAFPDGRLAATLSAVERVASFLTSAAPEVVMVPAVLDPHPDHRAAAEIAARALDANRMGSPSVWMYEIQPCFPMNALVRIDEVEEVKARALAEHRSQGAERLIRAARGLASCRALYAPPGWQSAEAFRIGSASNFLDLCRSLGLC